MKSSDPEYGMCKNCNHCLVDCVNYKDKSYCTFFNRYFYKECKCCCYEGYDHDVILSKDMGNE